MKIYSLVWVALIIQLTSLKAQVHKVSFENQVDTVFKQYLGTKGPGCAVAVVKEGKVILRKGYGMANLEYNIPTTPSTLFDIASLSKEFTGLAISTLIQQGKLSADEDIHKYLPDVPDFGKLITVSNLLHHTSGVRDWPEALHAGGWNYEEEAAFNDIMRMVKQQKELDFEPGSEYQYSNTGYNLLAAIVEKVSGKSFREYTDSAIFQPLGMLSTHFLDDKGTLMPNLAYSYQTDGKNYVKIINVLTAYGSSSLYTSVDDLTKWMIHFQQQLNLKNPVYTRMIEKSQLNNGKVNDYGFGLSIETDRGLKTISHTGGWANYRTIILFYPDEKLSIIILSSSGDGKVYDEYIKGVAGVFLKGKFKSQNAQSTISKLPAVKVDSMILKRYAGTYRWKDGMVTITIKNGQIFFQYYGEDSYPTQAISDTSFFLNIAGLPVTFSKSVNGVVDSFTFRDSKGFRFAPYAPTTTNLAEYAGIYYSNEMETEYKAMVKNGKLVLHQFRLGDMELNTFIKDDFWGDMGKFHFYRDARGKLAGFKYSGSRVRNLRFEKSR